MIGIPAKPFIFVDIDCARKKDSVQYLPLRILPELAARS